MSVAAAVRIPRFMLAGFRLGIGWASDGAEGVAGGEAGGSPRGAAAGGEAAGEAGGGAGEGDGLRLGGIDRVPEQASDRPDHRGGCLEVDRPDRAVEIEEVLGDRVADERGIVDLRGERQALEDADEREPVVPD